MNIEKDHKEATSQGRMYIMQKLGISALNDMQNDAICAVGQTDKDVVILSATGTGKTLAYLIPLAEQILLQKQSGQQKTDGQAEPLALVIVPSRELALQSAEVLKSMGTGLTGMALYGGRPTMDEHRELRKVQPHIIFGTPGRLNDHIQKGNFDSTTITWLVIDEFDKCLEMGFQNEMVRLVDYLSFVHRRILLSATESEEIPRFVKMGHTVRVDYRREVIKKERVQIYKVVSQHKDKLETLKVLLLSFQDQSTVVFLNFRDAVERTSQFLTDNGFTVSMFHGGLDQRQREDALYRFVNGSANILVATDLASRGLDIPDIDNIVHYHIPETEENYVHRIGRTARWDKKGRAFFLLNREEAVPEYVNESVEDYDVEQYLNITQPPALPKMVTIYIGKGKRDKLSKGDIVGFLCKKGGLHGDEIGKISVGERFTYVAIARHRLCQVLKNVQGEKIKGLKTVVEELR